MSLHLGHTSLGSGMRIGTQRACRVCFARRFISSTSSAVPRSRTIAPAGPSRIPVAFRPISPLVASRRSATTFASIPTSKTADQPPPPPPPVASAGAASAPKIRVIPPSLDAIKEEGYMDEDVELLPEDQARMIITPEAIAQLQKITAREPPDVLEKGLLALRVGVDSGGCHGYQYTMAITEERGVDDYVFEFEGVKSIPVVVDLVSLGLLKGATLHHATELIGSSFRIQDNPQAKEGGNCGCGVSWELK